MKLLLEHSIHLRGAYIYIEWHFSSKELVLMLTVNRHRKICTSERIVLNVHLMTIMYINFGEGCWILDVNI